MLSEAVCAEISRLTEEALLQLTEQSMVIDRVTVIRGYEQLSLLHPSSKEYVQHLADRIQDLANLAQSHGRTQLADGLLALVNSLTIERPS